MNKRIKKKKKIYSPILGEFVHGQYTDISRNEIMADYRDRLLSHYTPYLHMPSSARIKYLKRLMHNIDMSTWYSHTVDINETDADFPFIFKCLIKIRKGLENNHE